MRVTLLPLKRRLWHTIEPGNNGTFVPRRKKSQDVPLIAPKKGRLCQHFPSKAFLLPKRPRPGCVHGFARGGFKVGTGF